MNLNRALQTSAFALLLTCSFLADAQPAPAAAKKRPAAAARAPAGEPSRPGFTYSIERAPSWVVAAKERPGQPVAAAPMHYRLIDEQWLVEPRSQWEYNHVVRVVNDAGGLAVASQIELDFDPTIQTLALHHLDVVREGKRISKLDRRKFQLLQRETQLERRMYDGRATLSIVLDDVRIGDEIDYAYSIRGANPVFGGKFVHTAHSAALMRLATVAR